MEHLEKYVIAYLEREGIASDRELLIDYTRKYMNGGLFRREWDIDRKFEKQNSLWRQIKDMRCKGKIKEIRRINHKPTYGNVWVSCTIFYKLA